MADQILERGELLFSTDSRILRELGERLVRRPETALIELVKNAYDADATECSVAFVANDELCVRDNGVGMTLEQFSSAWMRIGTASKASLSHSREYGREITGEKGIGRFSVRFLGERLQLETVAHDPTRSQLTRLTADFDWPAYDRSEDLGKVPVPFRLEAVPDGTQTGTTLRIRRLRHVARRIDARQVRTASIGLLSPLQSLMVKARPADAGSADPGFGLTLAFGSDGDADDVAGLVLDAYTMRARLRIRRRRLKLQVWAAGRRAPILELNDRVPGLCGDVAADIRFFPRREGAFRDLGIDGRIAYTWVKANSGVAVFDRSFRVSPYGESGDDWLTLSADAARNERRPRSSLAHNHFAMSDAELKSTSDNWMLRLPLSTQLVGVVQVAGVRSSATASDQRGLVAAADREGFVANEAFAELQDHVRGAVEAIAMLDRRLQREQAERLREQRLARLQEQAASAVRDIEANPDLPVAQRKRLVSAVTAMATEATAHEEATRERVRQLEVMSLLGVVAGFMTHEFGVALDELNTAHRLLEQAVESGALSEFDLSRLEAARSRLSDFTDYSTAYISGSRTSPKNSYTALPRVRLIRKTFGGYADERGVHIDIDINRGLEAPRVPTSLYDGIVLNLLTNALKAVTTEGVSDQPTISIRAWREKEEHVLEVADNGIGIPPVLRERVFDPLFTTTATNQSPLGSGMGLGLALVRASIEAFDGKVNVIDPPGGYSTCVQVRLPMGGPEQ